MESIGNLKKKFYNLSRGLVDYKAMKQAEEYEEYRQIAARLRTFDPESLTDPAEKMAFWINLYNTIVIHGIVELGIQSSVREISAFFANIAYYIGDFVFSAEEIEHGILRANARPPYRLFPLLGKNDTRRGLSLAKVDPRIHFALVCGSRSCAPIRFYDPALIDEQLDRAAKNFVNSSEVIIMPEKNKVFLSQIFRWYKRDFGGKQNIFNFLLKYHDKNEKSEFLKQNINTVEVEYLFYDWNLNH